MRGTTRLPDRVNDLAFADDIALLETDPIRAQAQLDELRLNARMVGLEINVKKTEQMRLNQPDPSASASAAKLSIDNQDIEVVEDFKYLYLFVGSTEHDVRVRIGLAWTAFAKLKTILRSPKPTVSFKIRIFQAACILVLLYGCESWILTTALAKKLDIFARTCYRIILGVKQSRDHITDEVLYQRAGQECISELVCKRQLSFTGHCLRMDIDEPIHRYLFYESAIKRNTRSGRLRKTYRQQISSHIHPDEPTYEVDQIRSWAANKSQWSNHFVVPRKKRPPDPSAVPAQ